MPAREHPVSSPRDEFHASPYSIDIKLDFELFSDGRQQTPTSSQLEEIKALFPTCTELTYSSPFLIATCETLPPKPWPVTVAGLPLFVTPNPESEAPLSLGSVGYGPGDGINEAIRPWQTPSMKVFKKLFALLRTYSSTIDRVRWLGWGIIAVGDAYPPRSVWQSIIPRTINGLPVRYVFGHQRARPEGSHTETPADLDLRKWDMTPYSDPLRPGMMICSPSVSKPGTTMFATTGVCVHRDYDREAPDKRPKYITLLPRTFGSDFLDGSIHQASPEGPGREIAGVYRIFNDVALGDLLKVKYTRETISSVPNDEVKPFGRVLDTQEVTIGEPVFMDTPVNGRLSGILISREVRRITDAPDGEGGTTVDFTTGDWIYFGNGAEVLGEGSTGGVVWNEKWDVLGHLGWRATWSGVGSCYYCPAFDVLVDVRYELTDAP